MVASIGAIASPAQGAGYFERDGYYTKDDPAHREASAWAGKGAEALGLSGPVDSDTFKAILEGKVPDGPHLGKRGKDGEIHHRPWPRRHHVRAEIGLADGNDRRRRAHRRRPRPGRKDDARLDREERDPDPHAGSPEPVRGRLARPGP